MHALDLGTVDEDLAPRTRVRQAVDRARIELDGERLALAAQAGHEVVGAQRRLDQVEIATDDGVVVDVGHILQRVLDLGGQVLGGDAALRAGRGIEAGDEQVVQIRARCRDSG